MKNVKYETLDEKDTAVSVRDLSRNFSHYIANLDEPLIIKKHGVPVAKLSPISQKKKKKKSLLDLPFFKDFVEPEDWKGKSSLQIANELREKATKRWED